MGHRALVAGHFMMFSLSAFGQHSSNTAIFTPTKNTASEICSGKERFFEVPSPDRKAVILGTQFSYQAVGVDLSFVDRQLDLFKEANRLLVKKMDVPSAVSFILCPLHSGPERRDDRLEQHLMLVERLKGINDKIGSQDDALTINLHEYGHAVFDVNARKCSKAWLDRRLLDEELGKLFDQVKDLEMECQMPSANQNQCKTQLIKIENKIEEIKDKQGNDRLWLGTLAHEELFADMLAAFTRKDPEAVSKGLDPFTGKGGLSEFEVSCRSCINTASIDQLKDCDFDHYRISAPVRALAWRAYESAAQKGEDRRAEILMSLVNASCQMIESIAKKPSFDGYTAKTFNEEFLGILTKDSLFHGANP